MAMRVRRTEVKLPDNAFGERVLVGVHEVECPVCRRWTGLSAGALMGAEIFACPALGCRYRTQGDFRPYVEALRQHDLDVRAQRKAPL